MQSEQPQIKIPILRKSSSQDIEKLSNQKVQGLSDNTRKSIRFQIDLLRKQSQQFDHDIHLDASINKLLSLIQDIKVQISEIVLIYFDEKPIYQSLYEDLIRFKKTIILHQAQFGMIFFLLDMRGKPNLQTMYLEQFQALGNFKIPIDKIHSQINISILEQAYEQQIRLLGEYKDHLAIIESQLKKQQQKKLAIVKAMSKLSVINSKMNTITQIFPYACIVPKNDLFTLKKTHQRWRKLIGNCITFRIYGARDKIAASFDALKANINIVNASMKILNQNKNLTLGNINNWNKLLQSTIKLGKIALNKSEAFDEAELMISQGNKDLARQIWNLPDQKTIKNMISFTLPSITYHEKYYIPRIFKQYLDSKGKLQIPQIFIDHPTKYGNQLFQPAQYKDRLKLRINCAHRIRRIYQQSTPKTTSVFNSITNAFKNLTYDIPQQLVFHIHGGGFISMSTHFHQVYIRQWANELNVPIISVQYGKAPEHPFPQGLYDCFEGYMWSLYCFRQTFQVEPKKIILVGDSAGGNLVASLTGMLIDYNLRKPDGILLAYPALNLNIKSYTPSFLTSLTDTILPHTFLKVCLQAYIQGQQYNPQQDYRLSPILLSDQILQKFPKTVMFVGSKDPFHDDCCRFVQRINNINPDTAKLTIFEQFPHGFLQFDNKTFPHQFARKATKQIQIALKQLLDDKKIIIE